MTSDWDTIMTRQTSAWARCAITTMLAASLAGCVVAPAARPSAAPASAASLLNEEQALASLQSGSVVLGCSATCAEAWNRSRPELARLYRTGEWRGLAVLTMRLNYRQDLAYYYLGRAAEGLGVGAAAVGYYRSALSLTTGPAAEGKCGTPTGGCDGVNLPSEDVLHIQIAQALVPRHAAAAAHAAQPKPDPVAAAAAPSGGWVDPPPSTP